MKRNIDYHLKAWKNQSPRKVLLLRGARQVGKTYSVRELGKTFPQYIEVNFEEHPDISSFFTDTHDPKKIVPKLSAYFEKPIIPGETLLFFDEIQACPAALSTLRFFYEELPSLHVIATGSLLEFVLTEIPSHGVGRIRSIFMFPMTINEFLSACHADALRKLISETALDRPLDAAFHHQLVDLLKTYLLVGGMPEAVKTYVETHDFLKCQRVLDDLLITFKDDFAKYKKHAPTARLAEVLEASARQLGHRFMYSKAESASSNPSIKAATEMLAQAGLVHKIYHSSAHGLPLGAQINSRMFKILPLDTGITQRLLGLNLGQILTASDFSAINKGGLAEQMVGLQLLAEAEPYVPPQLYFWQRESKSGQAEVDYIIQKNESVLPIEVKAGTKGQMQSLFLFMQERGLQRGLRVSLENFSQYHNIQVLPMYAVSRVYT
jgi:predicted AAA+ superfamily ATPase